MLIEADPPPPRRRARALLAASAGALALHALLLRDGEPAREAPVAASPAVQVRTVAMTVPTPAVGEVVPAVDPMPTPAVAKPASPQPSVRKPAAPAQPAVAPTAERAAPAVPPLSAAAEPTVPKADEPAEDMIVHTAARAPAPAATDDTPEAVPVYRTRLPPATTLRYEMRRGVLSGSGDLAWRPEGDRYETRLQAQVAGLQVLTETSTGRIDAHGIAPVRYTDQRARRGTQAANFQRDKGRITYSGPQIAHPLLPGAQDRVSWMVQIGAVLNAEPQHAAPGGRIVFFVSGAQGDADVWAFRYVGTETVTSGLGAIHAVRFTREPRKTYDKQVDVWLAPAHQHLPVRARFTATANGEVFELLLRDIRTP